MKAVFEFDVDFSKNHVGAQIIHYKGYRMTRGDFLKAGGPYCKYFKGKSGLGEKIITTSYESVPNNRVLDNRVKTFMRDNELTVCEAFFIDERIPKMPSYVVNYSFDDYKTFGTMLISSFIELSVTEYYRNGVVCMQQGDYDHATANFSQVCKIDPYFATAYYNRGASYYKKGYFDTAIADLTQALKIDPSFTAAKKLLGRLKSMKLGCPK